MIGVRLAEVNSHDLTKYGTPVANEEDAEKQYIQVKAEDVTRITSGLLADLPIHDITITDPPIEDVIEQAFKSIRLLSLLKGVSMLLIFQRLWQVNWAEQWQYRANLIMYLLYWLVSPIIYLAVWTSIANSKGDVNGFTANDFITYYMTLLIVDQITSNIVIHTFAYKIQDGTLSGELIRPIHPMLTNALVNNISFKALTIMGLIPVWIVLFFLFKPDFSNVTLNSILLAAPAAIIGFFIGYLLSAVHYRSGILDDARILDP